MKYLRVYLLVFLFAVFNANAKSLKDVFNKLSKVPDMEITEKEPPETIVFDKESYTTGWLEVAKASRLDSNQFMVTGDSVMSILDKDPLKGRILCADNNKVGIYIYALSNGQDEYEMLLIMMSLYRKEVTILYNTINNATLKSLQEASVNMQNANLVVLPNRTDTIYVGGINEIVIEGPK